MNERQTKFFLSQPRFSVYLDEAGNDFPKAFKLYQSNIELSESLYPVLSVLEVSLRNAINERLKSYFDDPFWFRTYLPAAFQPSVLEAEQKIRVQKKIITADKIIAELNFGFWNRLFNRHYARLLWKPLRIIFSNLPKHLRQRDTIADSLYLIRVLRNKIYHYEPVFRNLDDLEIQYFDMITFLSWLDDDLPHLIHGIDRFQLVLTKAREVKLS